MHLYFIFSKNVNSFQDLKYNVHLCALWGGHGENEMEAAEEAFPFLIFFSSLLPLL